MTLRLFFGYYVTITLYEKISILGPGAQYDTCGPKDFGQTTSIPGVYHAKFGSHVCRLFKVLQTNHCQNNCRYCAFRRDRPCLRATSTPDEMANAFDLAYRRRLVDGLFLSSGIINNPDTTMTAMLDTLSILRQKYHYRGYVHLKIMPGTSDSCISESFKLANRISLNIESPTETDLAALSPDKNLKNGFFNTLFKIKKQINRQKFYGLKHPSLTTQFVVGAGEESDLNIVRTTNLLYQNFNFSRVFYSAFRPIPQTPLADKPPTPLVRQNRLYQVDFLMRFYRFSPSDLFFNSKGILPDNFDPKTIWAQRHPEFFPVNLRTADYWTILKIPGLGPIWAKRIISLRPSLSSLRLPAKSLKYLYF